VRFQMLTILTFLLLSLNLTQCIQTLDKCTKKLKDNKKYASPFAKEMRFSCFPRGCTDSQSADSLALISDAL